MGAIKQETFGRSTTTATEDSEDLGITAYEAFKDEIVAIYPSWTSWDTLSAEVQDGFRTLAESCFSLGYERGFREGREAGHAAGYATGHTDGYQEGLIDGENS